MRQGVGDAVASVCKVFLSFFEKLTTNVINIFTNNPSPQPPDNLRFTSLILESGSPQIPSLEMAQCQTLIPMDDVVLGARVRSMYNSMIRGHYTPVIRAMNATLSNLNEDELVYMDRDLHRFAHDKIARALVKMAVRDYQGAHAYLRELHYTIMV